MFKATTFLQKNMKFFPISSRPFPEFKPNSKDPLSHCDWGYSPVIFFTSDKSPGSVSQLLPDFEIRDRP